LPNFVGLKFQIHNGKKYDDITITEDMVGHKLGEFAPYVFAAHNGLLENSQLEPAANSFLPGRVRTSDTRRPRTSRDGVASAFLGSLGITCVYLDVLLLVQNMQPHILGCDSSLPKRLPIRP
jgi:hypothetical protein